MKKRIMAILLCCAMFASLGVTAGADYSDSRDISAAYERSVSYLSDLGVLNGFENSDGSFSFMPKSDLTRAEAAKIVAYIMTGGDTDSLTGYYTAHPGTLTDVGASWAKDFIAFCVENKVVNGLGGNIYSPGGRLTGYQAAKMLLCALGYNESGQLFTGSIWDRQVSVVGEQLGLFDGLAANFDLSAAISREAFCQMAYTAMTTISMVEKKGGVIVMAASGTLDGYAAGIGFDPVKSTQSAVYASEARPVFAFLSGRDGAASVTTDYVMSYAQAQAAFLGALGFAATGAEAEKALADTKLLSGLTVADATANISLADFGVMAGNAINYVFPNGEPWGSASLRATNTCLADGFGYGGEFSGSISGTSIADGIVTSTITGTLSKSLASFGADGAGIPKNQSYTATGAFSLAENGAPVEMSAFKSTPAEGVLSDNSGGSWLLPTYTRQQIAESCLTGEALRSATAAATVACYIDGGFSANRTRAEATALIRSGQLSGIAENGEITKLNSASFSYDWITVQNRGTTLSLTINGVNYTLQSSSADYSALLSLVPATGNVYEDFFAYTLVSGRPANLSRVLAFSVTAKSLGADGLITADNVKHSLAANLRLDGAVLQSLSAVSAASVRAIIVNPLTGELTNILTGEGEYLPVYVDSVARDGTAALFSISGESLPSTAKLSFTAADAGKFGYLSVINGSAARFVSVASGSTVYEASVGATVNVPKGATIYTLAPDRSIVTQRRSADGSFLANSFFRTLVYSENGVVESLFVIQPTAPRIGVYSGGSDVSLGADGLTRVGLDLYPYGRVTVADMYLLEADGSATAISAPEGKNLSDVLAAILDGSDETYASSLVTVGGEGGADKSAVLIQLGMLSDGTARAYLVSPNLRSVKTSQDGLLITTDIDGDNEMYFVYGEGLPVYDLTASTFASGASIKTGDTVVTAYNTDGGGNNLLAVYIVRTPEEPATPTPTP